MDFIKQLEFQSAKIEKYMYKEKSDFNQEMKWKIQDLEMRLKNKENIEQNLRDENCKLRY